MGAHHIHAGDLGCAGWPHSANDFAAAEQRDEAPREVPPPPVAPPPAAPRIGRVSEALRDAVRGMRWQLTCGRCRAPLDAAALARAVAAECPRCGLLVPGGAAAPSLASAVGAARFGRGGSRALPDSSVVDGHDANVRPRGAGDR